MPRLKITGLVFLSLLVAIVGWTQGVRLLRTTISVQDLTTGQPVTNGETIRSADNVQVTLRTNGLACAGQVAVTSSGITGTSTEPPECALYPAGYVPFTQITSTAVGTIGGVPVTMVVGYTTMSAFDGLSNVPLPSSPMQSFCWPVSLAPNAQWTALVPTAAMRAGDFGAFSGQLIDPTTNEPLPGNIIPVSEMGSVFAWPTVAGSPWGVSSPIDMGPSNFYTFTLAPFSAVALPSGSNDWKISTSCNGVLGLQFSSGNFEFYVDTNP